MEGFIHRGFTLFNTSTHNTLPWNLRAEICQHKQNHNQHSASFSFGHNKFSHCFLSQPVLRQDVTQVSEQATNTHLFISRIHFHLFLSSWSFSFRLALWTEDGIQCHNAQAITHANTDFYRLDLIFVWFRGQYTMWKFCPIVAYTRQCFVAKHLCGNVWERDNVWGETAFLRRGSGWYRSVSQTGNSLRPSFLLLLLRLFSSFNTMRTWFHSDHSSYRAALYNHFILHLLHKCLKLIQLNHFNVQTPFKMFKIWQNQNQNFCLYLYWPISWRTWYSIKREKGKKALEWLTGRDCMKWKWGCSTMNVRIWTQKIMIFYIMKMLRNK